MTDSIISETLTALLQELNLPFASIKVSKEDDITRVDIESSSASRIIGWHGETLNSIQHILKAIVRSKENLERSPFIVLDVDGYRRAQEIKVQNSAQKKADFVRRTGNRVALPPMSPYFRRIVHLFVASAKDMQDITTESSGEGDYRQIILRLKDESAPKKEEKPAAAEQSEELSPVIEEDGLGNLDI
ncbi:KH domain-containing protein [Candidatus Peregrinibacteria bacterium]|jgi:spoIIIJ-associated protein|nr:KH domain-containing protein [Candidatus Peregrinibacteria bacterium]MBT3598542.1 KH domain-containing protein [Candidatus Peregrinibacteria bacterium]MBT4367647.1 KH domain-containing protein [Candidatus Peregrinibacteria bacterium]MBT4586203.1 KH domain-containing protein [Candidatus Peregrinibacteria bacterium]MBT6730490.1 KH domain-containing protein [Candidatus Peregrinibacteria bacterium]